MGSVSFVVLFINCFFNKRAVLLLFNIFDIFFRMLDTFLLTIAFVCSAPSSDPCSKNGFPTFSNAFTSLTSFLNLCCTFDD